MESSSPSGSIVVEGHELHEEDIRLMYTFDQAPGGTAQFEAHSDAQVFFCSLQGSLQRDENMREYFTYAFPDYVDSLSQGKISQLSTLDWLY